MDKYQKENLMGNEWVWEDLLICWLILHIVQLELVNVNVDLIGNEYDLVINYGYWMLTYWKFLILVLLLKKGPFFGLVMLICWF